LKAGKYEIPDDLLYTKEHEWLKTIGEGQAEVGITHYAAEMLHDIVFVTLPSIGAEIQGGKAASTVESVKSVSDVMAPVSGKATAVNEDLAQHPETINQDPYGRGWFFRMETAAFDSEKSGLLTPAEYAEFVTHLAAQEG
jgi:glycine cleavage system H protein